MSIEYACFNNHIHDSSKMLPQSAITNSNLKNGCASYMPKLLPGLSCISTSKQGNSQKIQAESKSLTFDKSLELPESQTDSVHVNDSIKECTMDVSPNKPEKNELCADQNGTVKPDVTSIKDSIPCSTLTEVSSKETFDFISVGSDMTDSNSEDSSPLRGGTSTEDGGFIETYSLMTTNTPNQESKVVVQVLSNVVGGKISALEHCIDISEIPLNNHPEKSWGVEEMPHKQRDEQVKFLTNGNEERLVDDFLHQEKLSSRAFSKGKMRRSHAMNLHIRSGNGDKLSDFTHIVSNVENASPSLLGFLHKILFGTYGVNNNENALSQTKHNILHFSGFPFSENAENFETKRKCLLKVPYQMLNGICHTLLGKAPRTRNDSVEDLLQFMLKPTISSIEKQQLKTNQEESIENEVLPVEAQTDKVPIVLVQKLEDSFVKELLEEMDIGCSEKHSMKDIMVKDYKPTDTEVTVPSEVKTQLKAFPEVVVKVMKARRRIINVLHILFYGRPGSDGMNRLNILEFGGFTDYSENNFRRKTEFLKKLKIIELNQMCRIFSLRIRNCSQLEKILNFLHHLEASSLMKKQKRGKRELQPQNKEAVTKKRVSRTGGKRELQPQNKETITMKNVPRTERKMESVQPIKKLKDFEKIRRNIECASPEELTELCDLLFLMPSDNLEIHQRILEFSSSSFRENSPEFHSRRTLLYYMSFDVIKKISSLLEITDWEEYSNPQDLATTLLRFLMDMKPSVNIRPKVKPHKNGLRGKESSSLITRPHLMRLQKDTSCLEKNFNADKYPNSPAMHNPAFVEGFHEERSTSVVVRRITESSYSFTDLKNNEPVTVSDCNSEESFSLYKFIQHPSEKQLEVTIREMVCTNAWSSTMGELINRVFQCYPKFDLTYRLDFIKSKAIEVLHELQCSAEPFGDVM